MRIESKYIEAIRDTVEFIIGEDAADNFNILDMARPDDIWFHLFKDSSCHIIATLPPEKKYEKKQLYRVIIQGCMLCKQNSKYASAKKLPIMYSPIKNVEKTPKVGCVAVNVYKILEI